ncbi:MAG: hypothetical protein P4L84_28905 [Isosphaeraceae bacterium]|nr:hypothetical protein [Isosphaeraceae bacterium]
MPAVLTRTAAASLLIVLATAVPGCDRPEGLGTVDVDTARQALVAQGRPDPLAPAGVARYQVPRKAVKRLALARPR